MKKVINCFFITAIALYLYELLCVAMIFRESIEYLQYTYYAAVLYMVLWIICLVLEKQMTLIQYIIFLVVTICNLCAVIPGFICIVTRHSWTTFPPILLPLVIALSPFTVSLTYFPPNEWMGYQGGIMGLFLLLFVFGIIRSCVVKRKIMGNSND